ncbi:MAG TPA: MGMT family protein [candidate division CPR3 bacterium]|uniref:MGMT family protein n=1 Tax=candidate division CPR3 bacterium TaxID=2268181 RepID=A0A7C1NJK7_UNCC3|nr:MGMT family protein [candidate division CPR3 bacterium]
MQRLYSKRPITSFQKKVAEAVKRIPKGETRTYRQIAEYIGQPLACRAVGNALNKNRNPEVPCHRVIREDGSVGGYGMGGAEKKLELLHKEGVKI